MFTGIKKKGHVESWSKVSQDTLPTLSLTLYISPIHSQLIIDYAVCLHSF